MANQDHLAATTTNQANVINNLNTAWGLYSNYDQYGYNDDAQCVTCLLAKASSSLYVQMVGYSCCVCLQSLRELGDAFECRSNMEPCH